MRCTACGKWVHTRFTDKKVTAYLASDFVCKKCGDMVKNLKGLEEIWCDGVETVTKVFYATDSMHVVGGKQL